MKLKISLTLASLSLVGHLFAQGGTTGYPIPQNPTKERIAQTVTRALHALRSGNFALTAERAREIVALEATLTDGRYYQGPEYLGQALYGLGRFAEAKVELRKCFWLNSNGQLSGAVASPAMAKYAQILAMGGEWDAAKALYYAALSNKSQGSDLEIPFLIVFDGIPTLTHWEQNLMNFEVAFEMLVCSIADLTTARLQTFAELKGDVWPLVNMRLWSRDRTDDREVYYARALSACRTDQEREWVRLAHDNKFKHREKLVRTMIKDSGLSAIASRMLRETGPSFLSEPDRDE